MSTDKKRIGVGFSGACAATAFAVYAVGLLLQRMGIKVNCLTLADQDDYISRATTTWADIRNDAEKELAKRADNAGHLGYRVIVFGHSLGGIAAFLAAIEYLELFEETTASSKASDAGAESQTAELKPAEIEHVLLYNPSVSTSTWLWIFKLPALAILAFCHRVPIVGWLIPLIPVWRITSSAPNQRPSLMPLGMVWTIWRAQAELRRVTARIKRKGIKLPFHLWAIVGTSDHLCPAGRTAEWVHSIGGNVVGLGLYTHDLDTPGETGEVPGSELQWVTEKILEGIDPRKHA